MNCLIKFSPKNSNDKYLNKVYNVQSKEHAINILKVKRRKSELSIPIILNVKVIK